MQRLTNSPPTLPCPLSILSSTEMNYKLVKIGVMPLQRPCNTQRSWQPCSTSPSPMSNVFIAQPCSVCLLCIFCRINTKIWHQHSACTLTQPAQPSLQIVVPLYIPHARLPSNVVPLPFFLYSSLPRRCALKLANLAKREQ